MVNMAEKDKWMKRIRILIVDDHAVVRQGLARLVEGEQDLTVGAEVENAAQAIKAIEDQQFDLAIVDISLEDNDGLELTAELKSRCPSMTVLILSMYDGLLYAQPALKVGAAGYVAKYEAPEKIISAIHQVLGGKVYVSNSKVTRTLRTVASVPSENPERVSLKAIRPGSRSRY